MQCLFRVLLELLQGSAERSPGLPVTRPRSARVRNSTPRRQLLKLKLPERRRLPALMAKLKELEEEFEVGTADLLLDCL